MQRKSRLVRPLLIGASALALSAPVMAQSPAALGDIVVTAQRRAQSAVDVPISISAFSSAELEKRDISEPQDLYGSVPSLVVGGQGTASRDTQSFTIRGQATGYLSSPAVAMYMSEVPLPASVTLGMQGGPGIFFDLENVQVLKGPQGTLFGRNTTGGAVLFEPQKPTDDFEGYLEGSIGNLRLRAMEGAINVPVIPDKLMVRLSGAFRDRRGYTEDLVWNKWRDNTHWYSGRLGITFRPTEQVENYLMLYGSKSSTNGAGFVHRGWNMAGLQSLGFCASPPDAPIPGLGVPCSVYERQSEIADEIGVRKTRSNLDGYSRVKTWGLINKTSVELTDNLTLHNIVSFQKLRDDYAADQDGTPLQQYAFNQAGRQPTFPVPGFTDEFGLPAMGYLNQLSPEGPRDAIKQFTEELQLQGTAFGDRLTYTVGGFYYDAKPTTTWSSESIFFCPAAFTGLCGPQSTYSELANKSRALYGQATLDLGVLTPALERLQLTVGYRHTWDTITGFASSFVASDTQPGFVDCTQVEDPLASAADLVVPAETARTGCRFGDTLKSNASTWTFGLDYKPTDDIMLYAKVSRGYKAGGFNNTSVRASTRTFEPETLTSYEGGFKSNWWLGQMPGQLNATYFYSDYKNLLRPAADFNLETGAFGTQAASATAKIQGFEMEGAIQPVPGIRFGANLSHTSPKYKKFDYTVPASVPVFPACNGLVPGGGVADLTCRPFQFVTKWIYNLNASADIPLPDRYGELSFFLSYSHVSSQPTAPFSTSLLEPGSVLEPYGLVNTTLSWRNVAESGLDLTFFANNLFNKTYRVSNSNIFQDIFVASTLYGEPRTYGVKLRYRFGR